MAYENYQKWKDTPNTGQPHLSIVIPAYNESERILPTIGAIASHVSDLGFEWELIIADDGSKDNTVEITEALGFANMRVLKTPQNGGKGNAVQRGMLEAKGKYVLFADADNSTPIEEVSKLLHKLEHEDYDVAIGSRAAEGAAEANKSLFRHILSGGLRMMVNSILHVGVRDTQCGFKMYTAAAAKKLHSAQQIMGFSFDLEILYLASKFRYRVAEVPVSWIDAPGSKVDTKKEVIRFLKDMTTIRRNDWQGLYEEPRQDGLRIAVVSTYPPSKGSLNEYAYHFVRYLRQKPEVSEVIVLADALPDQEKYDRPERASAELAALSVVPTWRFNQWDNAFRIRRTVSQIKPDVVLFNLQFASFGDQQISAALGLTAPWLVKLNGYTTSVLLHNLMETVDLSSAGYSKNPIMDAVTRFFGNVFTRILLQADLVALTIPKYVELLRDKYKADNTILAPHGSFDDTPPPSMTLPDGAMKILAFGKFGTYKKVEKLIEAYEILNERLKKDIELIIAGSDSPNAAGYLEGIKKTYDHVNGLQFTGYVAEEDVPDLFKTSAVVVFPYTSTTGSSGVLHQAGSYGKACVLPKLGDFAELIAEEGYDGSFFEPDDVKSLADAIEKVLTDDQYRTEQGHRNYLASQGVFMADVVDWYLLHFDRILTGNQDGQSTQTVSVSQQEAAWN